jgi:PAS domain S-box-containing protein
MRLLKASPRWLLHMGGLREEDVRGMSLYDIRPDYFPNFRPFFDRCLDGETIKSDRVLSEHSGRKTWLKTELTPWRDEHGEVGGLVIAAHDITDLVRALGSAERSEERLQLAMATADIHVWEMDFRRKVLEKAGAEDTFFDKPKTYEELRADINATIDPRDRPAAMEAWNRHVTEGVPYRADYRVVRGDDKEVWASTSCREITDEAGPRSA